MFTVTYEQPDIERIVVSALPYYNTIKICSNYGDLEQSIIYDDMFFSFQNDCFKIFDIKKKLIYHFAYCDIVSISFYNC